MLKCVIHVLKESTKASVIKIICYVCAGISIPYIIGMAYCQLVHYSKLPKQREQRARRLMLSPVRVYVCHTKWWQLHTQASVKEVFSFCLSRLAMPEWWGRTIWMPRLFCLTNWKYMLMANYYCEYCGHRFVDARQLVSATCPRHPDGNNRGRHKLYEGTEKSKYTCKYCGHTFSSIIQMVGGTCAYHPKGSNKGAHAPAL